MSEESIVKQALQEMQSTAFTRMSNFEIGVLHDYIDYAEERLEDLLDDCEVFFAFPPVEDLRARGVGGEHTIKLMVDDVFLVSCCGTNPGDVVHRLLCWAEDMFDVDSYGCADA